MKSHIIIDARLYGSKYTGLGRYTKNLLLAIKQNPRFSDYKFTLLIYPELSVEIKKDLGPNFNYQLTSIKPYSIIGQYRLPRLLYSLQPDLVHFTQFDKPLFYFGKSVVTVHDLIKFYSFGTETTTRNRFVYWPKYFGYLVISWLTLKLNHLIVPSNYWRKILIEGYKINPTKVITTYEAVDPLFINIKKDRIQTMPDRYIIYTGNLYPHKNIEVIFSALKKLPDLKLKIICSRDIFQARAQKLISNNRLQSQVEFLGYVPDSNFSKIYSSALALVHPSLLEGFSFTGLEAMSLNCPVISSDRSCLPEIYQDSVLYFNATDANSLVSQIQNLSLNQNLRQELIEKGQKQIKKYSWTETARLTLNFYQRVLS